MNEVQEIRSYLFGLPQEDMDKILMARKEFRQVLDYYNQHARLALAIVGLEAQGLSVFGAEFLEGK